MTSEKKNSNARIFLQLTARHLSVFFRNKVRMFFTLLVPFIIFAIYVLFLRDLEMSGVSGALTELEKACGLPFGALKSDKTLSLYIGSLVDSWMLAGILAISTFTISFQTNTMIVGDRESGVNRDFISSPIGKTTLIFSYFFFNVIVTIAIASIFSAVCFCYLAFFGEFFLSVVDLLKIAGALCFASLSSVLFTVFVCSFISRDATMASVNTILSTAIGFLIGAYMPLGLMPSFVQTACAFFPGTYACSLLRGTFVSAPAERLIAYAKATYESGSAEFLKSFFASFGYELKFFDIPLSLNTQAIVHAGMTAILVIMNISSGSRLVKIDGKKHRFGKPKTK